MPGCQLFSAQAPEADGAFPLEPLALQDVPGWWHCCFCTKILWHRSFAVLMVPEASECLWVQLEGWARAGMRMLRWDLLPAPCCSCPQPGEPLASLPCLGVSKGAWHDPFQCNIPKADWCQRWQFCHTVPGLSFGQCVLGYGARGCWCPLPACYHSAWRVNGWANSSHFLLIFLNDSHFVVAVLGFYQKFSQVFVQVGFAVDLVLVIICCSHFCT